MPVRVEESAQRLKEQLNASLELEPEFVREFFIDNIVKRVVAYLMGWNYATGEPTKLSLNPDGSLRVSITAAPSSVNETFTGEGTDEWALIFSILGLAQVVDIWVDGAPLLFQRSVDGATWQDAFEVKANSFYSFQASTKAMRVKNASEGQSGTYQIVIWY